MNLLNSVSLFQFNQHALSTVARSLVVKDVPTCIQLRAASKWPLATYLDFWKKQCN